MSSIIEEKIKSIKKDDFDVKDTLLEIFYVLKKLIEKRELDYYT